jgi:hypothetical protein
MFRIAFKRLKSAFNTQKADLKKKNKNVVVWQKKLKALLRVSKA